MIMEPVTRCHESWDFKRDD